MRAFLFAIVCLVSVSCFDKGDCLFTNTNFVKVSLKDLAAPLNAKSVTFVSVQMPDDRFLLYQDTTLTSMYLLVNPRATETKYVFQYDTRSDTLVLGYTTQTIVLSPDCGSYSYQNDLAVVYSTFEADRVIITNQRLLTSVQNNVDIYF